MLLTACLLPFLFNIIPSENIFLLGFMAHQQNLGHMVPKQER
jgi:hypothetical protein